MPIHGKAAVSHGNDWVQGLNRPVPWIWNRLVAEDAVTLLAAPAKTGKTTLLSLLLDRHQSGEPTPGQGGSPWPNHMEVPPGEASAGVAISPASAAIPARSNTLPPS